MKLILKIIVFLKIIYLNNKFIQMKMMMKNNNLMKIINNKMII